MDNWTIFLEIPVLILAPVVTYVGGKGSVVNRAFGALGTFWIMGMLFFSEPTFNLKMGPTWLLVISPGFAILIYLKFKERQDKRNHNKEAEPGGSA